MDANAGRESRHLHMRGTFHNLTYAKDLPLPLYKCSPVEQGNMRRGATTIRFSGTSYMRHSPTAETQRPGGGGVRVNGDAGGSAEANRR